MVCKNRGIYGFLGPSWVLITTAPRDIIDEWPVLRDVVLHAFFPFLRVRAAFFPACLFSSFTQAVGLPGIPGLPDRATLYILYAYIVFAFAIGAPKLYFHMIRQRKKQLQGAGGKVKAS